jgi:hypothetical protein
MKELIRHILKEETEEIDKNVMNFLMRRYKVEEINIDDRIIFKKVYFNVDGEFYSIGTFDNKKRQIRLILNMLEENNVIEPVDNFSNENDPYRQKIVRTIKMFLDQVM